MQSQVCDFKCFGQKPEDYIKTTGTVQELL